MLLGMLKRFIPWSVLLAPAPENGGDGGGGAGAGGGAGGGAAAGAGGGGGTTTTTTPPPAVDPEVARLRKENEAFRAAEQKRKDDEAAATDEKKKKAQKDGDLQAQIDAINAEMKTKDARLAELAADAAFGKKHRETMTAEVDAALAKLPAADKALVEKLPLEDRPAMIARLTAAAAKPGANGGGGGGGGGTGPGGTPPPGGAADDIDALIASGVSQDELTRKHGPAFEAWKKKQVERRNGNANRPPWF